MKKKTPAAGRAERGSVLDAAERLFAQRSFHGMSLRELATVARAEAAELEREFGDKQALLAAVLARRAGELNRERETLLEAVLRAARPGVPTVEAILGSFTQPLIEHAARGGPQWRHYFALIAWINNSPEFGATLMTQHFDAVSARFIAALRAALPGCPPEEICWGYQFLSGALTLSLAATGRIDALSGGVCRAADIDGMHERLVPYVAAGLRALCARAGPAPRPGKRAERRARPRP